MAVRRQFTANGEAPVNVDQATSPGTGYVLRSGVAIAGQGAGDGRAVDGRADADDWRRRWRTGCGWWRWTTKLPSAPATGRLDTVRVDAQGEYAVVDSTDKGRFTSSSSGGSWISWTYSSSRAWQNQVTYIKTGGPLSATWSVDAEPGVYEVGVSWEPATNRSTAVNYQVRDAGGTNLAVGGGESAVEPRDRHVSDGGRQAVPAVDDGVHGGGVVEVVDGQPDGGLGDEHDAGGGGRGVRPADRPAGGELGTT